MLWCPAGKCICIGNFHWDSTAQNCSCGAYQQWVNVKCQDYGAYGDPCNTVPCNATLTCLRVINQTFTTSQDVCVCDSTTYLSTSGSTRGQCIPRLPYNSICQTNSDCQSWLGLACTSSSGEHESVCWRYELNRISLFNNRFKMPVRCSIVLERINLCAKYDRVFQCNNSLFNTSLMLSRCARLATVQCYRALRYKCRFDVFRGQQHLWV